jgi:pyruvate dehydrogenase E2 component (dihydrolipoamide acetyltransferase)
MSYIFKMPAVGEGISEGKIAKWLVAVGDSVEEDATIVEIQNDKLIQEIPSPVNGIITKLLVETGAVAQVGDSLAEIDAPNSDDSEEIPQEKPKEKVKESVEEPTTEDSNYVFYLPNVGEGITEGKLVKWEVSVGDTIVEDETIVEVQNDKLIQDVPSPVTGVIKKIVVEAGETAQVGDAIAEIEVEGHVAQEKQKKEQEPKEQVTAPSKKSKETIVSNRVLAMPSVRQYARDKDIEIMDVSGSGRHDHITKDDIDNYVSNPTQNSKEQPIISNEVKKSAPTKQAKPEAFNIEPTKNTSREKMSVTRRAISQAMVRSKLHAPHVTIFDEVEVSKLMDHRKRFKEVAANQDISLTFLAYMSKAVVTILRKYPILNSSVDEENEEIVYKHYYNIGIAVDTKRGLYVPNIKDADRKGMFTIADEITNLAKKANDGDLLSTEMRDGSTTISNIGSAWGMWFTPIINYPEVAIFGMGRIEKKPIVLEDNTLGIGMILHLSMSFDHRIVDGAVAQLAMNELKRLLADPELLLMEG